jgi:endoglucanase
MKNILMGRNRLMLFLFFIFSMAASAQVPFHRGVNLTEWFQASTARQIQFTKYTKKDFKNIKSLGCDVIRLPISLHDMTNGGPDYTLDPLFLKFLDKAADWAEELQIHLILDNHTFDPIAPTDPAIGSILVKVWKQMARHFKDRSNYIYYEILNEPHGITDAVWSPIQQSAIDAIRTEDTKHFIVVGPADYNSYNNLKNLPTYADTKLIYTFHFYDPFIFTHQGASWVEPSMVPLAGVPFPYNASTLPVVPPSLKGTWVEGALNDYVNVGTVSKIKEWINRVVDFKNQRNVPVFCGEFGVLINNSNNVDRAAWYQAVHSYLNEKGIPWTTWDYQGGFGLFKKGSTELFDNDLNVPLLQALEFNVPPQTEYSKSPKTTGFIIYDDYIGEGMVDASYHTSGTLDYYAESKPYNGSYNLYWTGVEQYSSIGFHFKQDADLSLLKDQDTLKFWVRGNSSSAKFDVRFIDTKTGANDHPWRMGKTIDNTVATWDGVWHRVQIPLKSLEEKGSWDNAFFNPEGKFDWTSIDRFEIVAEHQPLTGIEFSFDDIQISGKDIVTAAEVTSIPFKLQVYPNPMVNSLTIAYQLQNPGVTTIAIYNSLGQKIQVVSDGFQQVGNHEINWDGHDYKNQLVAEGIYLIRIESPTTSGTAKLIVKGTN